MALSPPGVAMGVSGELHTQLVQPLGQVPSTGAEQPSVSPTGPGTLQQSCPIVQHCDSAPDREARLFEPSDGTAVALVTFGMRGPATITVLVILNLALQVFDGAATYVGWEQFGEANPLLRTGFDSWGAGPTLLAAKLFATAAVLWVACIPCRTLAALGLTFTLGTYTALSFIPWSLCLWT